MTNDVRVVIDTNVFVSALAFEESSPFRAVELAFASATVLISEATVAELVDVLNRPKMARYFSRDDIDVVLRRLRQSAMTVQVAARGSRSRDPKDDAFLDLAIAGRARFLVTGDRDLLVLGVVGGTAIVTPAAFLDTMGFVATPLTPRT